MIKTYAHQLVEIAVQLSAQAVVAGGLFLNGETTVPEACIDEVRKHLNNARPLCVELGLRGPLIQVERLLEELPYHNPQTLAFSLKETQSRIFDELSLIYLFFVPTHRVGFYEKAWCGEKVEKAFPSAVKDIREAGDCYALGRWSGAVFHSMGILQIGLYALAKDLGVEFTRGIELENWKNIIDSIQSEIDKRIETTEQTSKGRAKDETLTFYSQVAMEFQYFKNAWRNHVAHLREFYDELGAVTVLGHVNALMQRLSEKISEVQGLTVKRDRLYAARM